jgi:hypothetical protein
MKLADFVKLNSIDHERHPKWSCGITRSASRMILWHYRWYAHAWVRTACLPMFCDLSSTACRPKESYQFAQVLVRFHTTIYVTRFDLDLRKTKERVVADTCWPHGCVWLIYCMAWVNLLEGNNLSFSTLQIKLELRGGVKLNSLRKFN